jgi:F-type H+-transporting ATPase subunit a
MADPILHIKDSYFFEVPKVLAPANYKQLKDLPEVWVKLDPTFQQWEFEQLYHELTSLGVTLPPMDVCHRDWQAWVHADHANFAKPFDEFLQEMYLARQAEFGAWKKVMIAGIRAAKNDSKVKLVEQAPIDDFLRNARGNDPYFQFIVDRSAPGFEARWNAVRHKTGSYAAIRKYQEEHNQSPEWDTSNEAVKAKFDAYNFHLSGKILIPQPFGELRNLHEAETTIISQQSLGLNTADFGFCISRFMLIEIAVGLVLWMLFSWLASRMLKGGPPRGRAWNFLEVFVVFIRDQIARPALDHHEHDEHGEHGHEAHGHTAHGHATHGHESAAHAEAAHAAHGSAHAHPVYGHGKHAPELTPSQRYTPLLCSIFFFILGCNLAGMLPWVGSPTGTWSVTLVMALVTLVAGAIGGIRQFGVVGYFLNQIPSMDLSPILALFLKPAIFVVELGGLLIKHAVLSVRLLANMLAGHMVLLAIMGISFGSVAAMTFVTADGSTSPWWWVAATCSIIGCTLLSMLELFVAFLQAYVFTLLSALFIGAAIHKH